MATQVNPIDAAELMTSMKGAQANALEAAAATRKSQAIAAEQYELAAQASMKEGTARAAVIQLDTARIMENSARQARTAAWLGANPDVASNEIQTLGQSIRDQRIKLEQSAKDIGDMKSVGFFDNPIEYIGNAFTLPSAIAQHNAEVDVLEINSGALEMLQNAQIRQEAINKGMEAKTTTEIGAAQATEAAAKAAAKAAELRYQAAVVNKEFISANLAASNMPNQLLIQTNGQIQAQINSKIANDATLLGMQEARQRMEQRRIEISNMERDAKDQTAFMAQLSKATTLTNNPPITMAAWKTMGQKERDNWIDIMAGSSDDGSRLATTVMGALNVYNSSNLRMTPETRMNVIVPLQAMVDKIKSGPNAMLLQGKKPGELEAAVNAQLRVRFQEEGRNVGTSDLYKLLPQGAYAQVTRITENPIWQLGGFTETSKNKMADTKIEDIDNVTARLVAEKKLSPQQAATALAELSSLMASERNTLNQYQKISVPAPMNLKAKVNDFGSMFSGTVEHDFTNPTANLNRILLREARATALQRFNEGGPDVFGGMK